MTRKVEKILPRAEAWEILNEYVDDPALLQHSQIVEAVMRYYARLNGENEEVWGVTGLLHDLDWQKWPELHTQKTAEILRERAVDEAYIHAIVSHGYHFCTDVKPETLMEQTLYTVDELTGLIAAARLLRPSRSVLDMEVKSARKKFKEPSFSRGVDRATILEGMAWLGTDLDTVIANCLAAMKENAEELGLKGNL